MREQTPKKDNAYHEVLAMLDTAKPVPADIPSAELSWAAYKHAQYVISKDKLSHKEPEFPDRVNFWDRTKAYGKSNLRDGTPNSGENVTQGYYFETACHVIARYMLDDGQPLRGHQHNIMRSKLGTDGKPVQRYVGTWFGPVPTHDWKAYGCSLHYYLWDTTGKTPITADQKLEMGWDL